MHTVLGHIACIASDAAYCYMERGLFVCVLFSSVLFFRRPRSEGWPHHGRTFSIYLCHLVVLIDSSTDSPVHVLMLSIQAVRGLPRLHALALFLALSLSPGNSLVPSRCDHSTLASLL